MKKVQHEKRQDEKGNNATGKIPASRYLAENLLLTNIYANMKTDGNIIGTGVFFEPNVFLSDYENYGLYITKKGAEEKPANAA